MDSNDVKKALPALYAPRGTAVALVEVPELRFLVVDGHGDPDVVPAYPQAVQALFTLSYGVRAVARSALGRVHTVGPLEGWWSAEDPRAFVTGDKDAWDWTLGVVQPPWVTAEVVDEATRHARRRRLPALDRVRLTSSTEGTCLQVLHVGPYEAEGPVLARLHEHMRQGGLTFNGRHHEVYLSDPRRVEPARLRTVLRQPVAPVPPLP